MSRIGFIAVCFWLWQPSLWYVSAGFLLSSSVGLVGDVLLWRRLSPELHIDKRKIDGRQVRALTGLSVWSMINFGGALLLWEMNLIIVNTLDGPDMTGRYGSVLLFPTLIETLTGTVANVLSPAIMARYAVGDLAGVEAIASQSVSLLRELGWPCQSVFSAASVGHY